jgi:hypothetical protein
MPDSSEKHGEGWCLGFVPALKQIAGTKDACFAETNSPYQFL